MKSVSSRELSVINHRLSSCCQAHHHSPADYTTNNSCVAFTGETRIQYRSFSLIFVLRMSTKSAHTACVPLSLFDRHPCYRLLNVLHKTRANVSFVEREIYSCRWCPHRTMRNFVQDTCPRRQEASSSVFASRRINSSRVLLFTHPITSAPPQCSCE
jgi:hypothetical protein